MNEALHDYTALGRLYPRKSQRKVWCEACRKQWFTGAEREDLEKAWLFHVVNEIENDGPG